MICQKCHGDTREDGKFCQHCGANIELASSSFANKCPICGVRYPLSKSFCVADGARLVHDGQAQDEDLRASGAKSTPVCPRCGTVYPVAAKYCKLDGSLLTKRHTEAVKAVPVSPRKDKRRSRTALVVFTILILALTTAGWLGYVYYFANRRIDTIEVRDALRNGDVSVGPVTPETTSGQIGVKPMTQDPIPPQELAKAGEYNGKIITVSNCKLSPDDRRYCKSLDMTLESGETVRSDFWLYVKIQKNDQVLYDGADTTKSSNEKGWDLERIVGDKLAPGTDVLITVSCGNDSGCYTPLIDLLR